MFSIRIREARFLHDSCDEANEAVKDRQMICLRKSYTILDATLDDTAVHVVVCPSPYGKQVVVPTP